jgi:hypothetical protein
MLLLRENQPTFQDFYLELLTRYTQVDKYNSLKVYKVSEGHAQLLNIDVLPRLLTSDNRQVYSPQEISTFLLKQLNWDKLLIGQTPEERSNTLSYFDLVANAGDSLLASLHHQLRENTFLTGSPSLTVADLYVFAHLFQTLVNATHDFKVQYYNVSRWFDYIQNLRGIKESLVAMKFRLMEPVDPSAVVEQLGRPDNAAIEGKKTEKGGQGQQSQGGKEAKQKQGGEQGGKKEGGQHKDQGSAKVPADASRKQGDQPAPQNPPAKPE